MDELSPEQKKKLERYATLHDDLPMGMISEMDKLSKEINGERGIQQVEIMGAEVVTIEGKKGDKGDKGDKGEQGVAGKDGKDGRDGIDGNDGRDGIDGEDGKDGSPDSPEEIVDKVNVSKTKILKSQIEGLENDLSRIEKIASQYRGGGTSSAGVAFAFKSIAHTEEPTGDIDGVNTTYTVQNNIWWVFGFTLNGEQIAELPNFTYVNRTITFATALPAVYSGKDFEIKYIGT